ncbi:MAG: hypothetical protein ACI4RO_03015 [Candidatus Scatosoma sp.]
MAQLPFEILELYEKLYKLVDEANEKNKRTKKIGKLTICPAVSGSEYDFNGKGLMFVGRAINGWCPLNESMINTDIKTRIKRCEKCTLDWVVGKNNWTNCRNNGCPYAQAEDRLDGRKSSSPFWQMIEFISAKNGLKKDDWYKKIIWSNLYKASYTNGKNPTNFYEKQVELCNEILIKEIEYYKPLSIYFLTEKNKKQATKENRTWFCEQYKETTMHFKKLYDYLRNKNIKVFVLTRPEFQIKDELYKAKQDLEGKTIPN